MTMLCSPFPRMKWSMVEPPTGQAAHRGFASYARIVVHGSVVRSARNYPHACPYLGMLSQQVVDSEIFWKLLINQRPVGRSWESFCTTRDHEGEEALSQRAPSAVMVD